jgi:phosphatidylserine/phosphatidylglycerophosphate/cardiolipin synthase-like enzyme
MLVITQQLLSWVIGLAKLIQQQCSHVITQVVQKLQQWQTSCTSVISTVCSKLPWPLSFLCAVVTVLVCIAVSVVILLVATVVVLLCIVVTVVVTIAVLLIVITVVTLFSLICILAIPLCANRMEASTAPDPGLVVTEGGTSPPRLSMNNRTVLLPDAELACKTMVHRISLATTTIHLLQLEFDPKFTAEPAHLFTAPASERSDLIIALIAAAQRGVKVRILMNSNVFANTIPALTTAVSGETNIELQGFPIWPTFGITHTLGIMHAKGMSVDSATAFVVGLPFEQGYWDTQSHLVTDTRRGNFGGGSFIPPSNAGAGVGLKPVHTVSLRIDGPAALDFDVVFSDLWNKVSSNKLSVSGVAPPVGGGSQSVQVVLSAPPRSESRFPSGETGSLEAYLRAIANAKRFLYFENQYFTSPIIRDALIRALKANTSLQLIMLLNENPDLPTYKFWQEFVLGSLFKFAPAQFGAFTLWRTRAPTTPGHLPEIMQCYLESKVTVVDDVWAMVGSANLDGGSLGHIFEFLPKPWSCESFRLGWRNVELSTVLYDGVAGNPPTGEVFRLREILWKEHLGLGSASTTSSGAGGFLGLWQSNAAGNVGSLNATQVMAGDPVSPSRILPYSTKLDTVGQLTQLGVNVSLFDVAPVVPP